MLKRFVVVALAFAGLVSCSEEGVFEAPESGASALPSSDQAPSNPAPGLVRDVQLNAGPEYSAHEAGGVLRALNPSRELALSFLEDRVEVERDEVRAQLHLARVGRAHSDVRLSEATRTVDANRVDYGRGAVGEWFLNGPLGLQQGFTVAERPAGEGLLELDVKVGGDLRPVHVGTDVELHDDEGAPRFFYGGLQAMDASGTRLSAVLAAAGDRILIRVDDESARYPIMIDPILVSELATLTASDGAALDEFGGTPAPTAGGPTVAIDGAAALVASTYDGVRAGGVYVFRDTAGTWAEEVKLTRPAGLDANARFGYSVALEGDTAVVSAPLPLSDAGQVFVFTRVAGTWSQRAVLTNGGVGGNFGSSVAISGDTIVVGARYAGTGGVVYVYRGGGASWALEQSISGTDTAALEDFGSSVDVDGDTIAVGAVFHPIATRAGAVYIFTRSGTTWTQRTKLSASDAASLDLFSRSLQLDGSRLLVGAPQNTVTLFSQGAVYVFSGVGAMWNQDQRLVAGAAAIGDQLGYAVSIDGLYAIAGARFGDAGALVDAGRLHVYRSSAGTFGDETLYSRTGAAANERFGDSVALSGTTAIVGAPFVSSRSGNATVLALCDGCRIGGVCLADGSANPSNSCEVCDATADPANWSARPDGTSCNDGLFCTLADQCTAGVCGGAANTCSDGLSCTGDMCNETADRCENPVTLGCLIGGACVAQGAPNPGDSCELCDGVSDRTDWSTAPNGTSCDDGLFCTTADACTAGRCGGAARDCSDALPCTIDSCDETADACESVISVGCSIGGACIAAGTINPLNQCEECNPGIDPGVWTARASGAACDDGLFCTSADSCSAGACTGAPVDCSDGLSCTSDSCNEATNRCENSLNSGCLIGGLCVGAGTPNPLNECEACDATTDTANWSPRGDGTLCDDGLFCTSADACLAGACVGAARDCSDAFPCTTDSCNEATDSCDNPVTDGCLVGGACIAALASDPANPCRACLPPTSTTDYSNVPDATRCGDPSCDAGELTTAATCLAGACEPGTTAPCPDGLLCASPMMCAGGCTNDDMCGTGSYCDVGDTNTCLPTLPLGAACGRVGECAVANCVDGVCCDGACGGTCETCALAASPGVCSPVPADTDPADECPLSCDGARACQVPMDAGVDGGPSDAGSDVGVADAGPGDADLPDGVSSDASLDASLDGGELDAAPDAEADAAADGSADGAEADASVGGVSGGAGCSVGAGSSSNFWLLAFGCLWFRRRRN